jgi:hypothetical protein
MDWKDVGGLVAKAAPLVGTVLGGPVGGIVGAAGALVGQALGCEPTPQSVAQAVQADPEAALKLKQLEVNYQSRLITWQEKQMDAEIQDRKSARSRDVALHKRGGNLRGDILAFAAIGGLVSLVLALLFVELQSGPARDVLLMLAGGLVAIVKDVYGFEFGSSRGSKDKTTLMGVKDA